MMSSTDNKKPVPAHRSVSVRRVLFVNHVAARGGGAEASLMELILALDRQRYEPVLVAPESRRLTEWCAEHDIDLFQLELHRLRKRLIHAPVAALSLLRAVPALTRIIRNQRIALVHANSNTAQVYAALAAQRVNVPLLWHSRDLVNLGMVGRFLASRSSRVIGISAAVTAHLSRYCRDATKLRTILNGIDTDSFCSAPPAGNAFRRQHGIPETARVIGMIGHFVPWKKHALFLQVAAELQRREADVHFLIVGGDLFDDAGISQADVEQQARQLGVANRTTFTGLLDDVVPALDAMEIVAHPAEREPFGRAIVEAMCRAKPVVAINACGPAEIVRDGIDGRLVSPDPASFAEALADLLHTPARARELGQAAIRRARSAFSVQRVATEVQSLYDEVLTGTHCCQAAGEK